MEKSKPGRSANQGNPLILIIALFVFGLVLGGFGMNRYKMGKASEGWPTVTGTIISSRTQTRQTDGKNEYMPSLSYSYTVEGRNLVGSRITASEVYQKNRQSAEEIVRRYAVGTEVQVHYDPEAPERAVLEPGLPGNVKILLGGGGVCIFLAVAISVSVVKKKFDA
ncbi:MAG: DUF3592 domain-containing protein [bacterium]